MAQCYCSEVQLDFRLESPSRLRNPLGTTPTINPRCPRTGETASSMHLSSLEGSYTEGAIAGPIQCRDSYASLLSRNFPSFPLGNTRFCTSAGFLTYGFQRLAPNSPEEVSSLAVPNSTGLWSRNGLARYLYRMPSHLILVPKSYRLCGLGMVYVRVSSEGTSEGIQAFARNWFFNYQHTFPKAKK